MFLFLLALFFFGQFYVRRILFYSIYDEYGGGSAEEYDNGSE